VAQRGGFEFRRTSWLPLQGSIPDHCVFDLFICPCVCSIWMTPHHVCNLGGLGTGVQPKALGSIPRAHINSKTTPSSPQAIFSTQCCSLLLRCHHTSSAKVPSGCTTRWKRVAGTAVLYGARSPGLGPGRSDPELSNLFCSFTADIVTK
jgi:hypothetical protein